MSTILQQKLAEEIIKNVKRKKPKNKKELLVSMGYSITTAESIPNKIIEQKGVIEALEELGFSEEGAKAVVIEIMYDKKVKADARLKATDQVFKTVGSYAPEKHTTTNLNIDLDSLKEITNKLNEIYRSRSEPGNGRIASSLDNQIQDKE